MKRKILVRGFFGAPIGVTVSLIITMIISLCTGHGEYYPAPHELIDLCGNAMNAVLVQTFCAMLVGAACGISSVIWETEWSLLKQTCVHLVTISAATFPLAFVMYWIPHHVWGALAYIGAFVIAYAVIWITIYFCTKAKIKRLNSKLTEKNNSEINGI